MLSWIVIFSLGGLVGAGLQYLAMNRFGRGRIRLIDNIGRKFGAEPFYHHIEAYDKPSGNIDLLFTHQELNRAINRAENNKEDF